VRRGKWCRQTHHLYASGESSRFDPFVITGPNLVIRGDADRCPRLGRDTQNRGVFLRLERTRGTVHNATLAVERPDTDVVIHFREFADRTCRTVR